MPATDPRIDAYIEKAEDFARPILSYLREIVHEACPDVEETLKWGMPCFTHRGILCSMASFKSHCTFGFWKASLILEGDESRSEEAMGQFGRLGSIDDLPPREMLLAYVLRAVELNDRGIQPKRKRAKKAEIEMPQDFEAALRSRPDGLAAFEALAPGHRREYIEWIVEARRDETRLRRIDKAVNQISGGKSLNWKYE